LSKFIIDYGGPTISSTLTPKAVPFFAFASALFRRYAPEQGA